MRPESGPGLPLRLPAGAAAGPEVLDAVHDVLELAWARHPGVTAADRMGLETAVIEVAANIVEHASPGRRVEIAFEVDVEPGRIRAAFTDTGVPFDGDIDAAELPADELSERGRGLALARALVDELAYERAGPTNHWRVVLVRR